MKKLGVLLAALVLVAGMSYAAFAENATLNVSVNAVPKLTITVSTPSVNFGNLEPETPTTIANAVTVTVKSNRPFDYSYTATDFSSGADTYTIGILEYAPAGSGSFTAFSNAGTLATNEGKGVKTYSYDYRINIPYDMAAGAYSATITYTAVQR
jgi:hypothetical protein